MAVAHLDPGPVFIQDFRFDILAATNYTSSRFGLSRFFHSFYSQQFRQLRMPRAAAKNQ